MIQNLEVLRARRRKLPRRVSERRPWIWVSAPEEREGLPLCAHTKLHSEDVRSITRFDEHDLVLVSVVERFTIVHSDGEVERSSVDLCDCRELRNTRVLPGDQLSPSKSELRVV